MERSLELQDLDLGSGCSAAGRGRLRAASSSAAAAGGGLAAPEQLRGRSGDTGVSQDEELSLLEEYGLMGAAKTDVHKASLTNLFDRGVLNWAQAIEYLG
eukprot:CAMPEP_0206273702 /NCGR_PEP_ID=MMETSP0047_2-20121206/34749_1 /ASSEMBLY_ACC=CAM_ASM_000192 /TAXON_ID=195065 /ORGANISM="Chroomonas mesostigmatica_cf, Strain CCMP1168" /LENGTH=99 /DNA_ID=CAMNT_0053702841 /DNA_START=546 /DNA_END=843 /DNA_ORIENTATION=+